VQIIHRIILASVLPFNVFLHALNAVTLQVAPAGSRQSDQVLSVRTVSRSESCPSCSGVKRGDLLEIRYAGRLPDSDNAVFDGSAVATRNNGRNVAGRGGDVSIYFVLGQQPKGQFPPSFDLALVGMCIGETREVTVPPVLGYGRSGLQRRGIPPNATLQYTVELLSVNGIFLCSAS
jgi:FK506-binding protein 2